MSSSDDEPIVVACAADAGYVMPLAVTLASLVEHLDPSRALDVHIVDGGISREDREALVASLGRPNVRIRWLAARSSTLEQLPVWGRLPAVAWYQRLLLPELLPSVGKVIWLDCDLVVQRDLARLWDIDVGDRCVLAVQDMIIPFVSSFMGVAHHAELGIPASAKYFNAGVMVANLARWREHDVGERVRDYLRRHAADVVYLEQEGLNAVLAGEWGELDPRWNHNASVCGRAFYDARHLDRKVYEQVVREPWIVHFSGNIKPWSVRKQNTQRALYFRYLDRTCWAGWRPRATLAGTLLGSYDSSRLRNVLYPAEKWALELFRRSTRRRLPVAAADGA